ncbi:SpoIIE family protein phosphatase [Candidatus Soleaferrea massiliensis]|uniref:SpoIIE family protein phosphatase n=1 Tax=Candidatus Soleaferrea massiliensis TaxID=1470354 RepID=UPI00058B13BC|nr:SpoIIE family protein phosphatase [Candidatus Soleaferrea massiliensis]
MKKTQTVSAGVFERGAAFLKTRAKTIEALLNGVIGFIMAGSTMIGSLAPFGVAYCAASSAAGGAPAIIGALLGYILFSGAATMKYVAAAALVFILKLVFKNDRSQSSPVLPPVLSFISLLSVSIAIASFGQMSFYNTMLDAGEAFLAAGSSYFFYRTNRLLQSNQSLHALPTGDLCCLIVTVGVMICSMVSLRVGGFSVGRSVAVLLVLLCARYLHESGGAISGIIMGLTVLLASSDSRYLFASYALGGLSAGIFSRFGRIGSASAFIISNGLVFVFSNAVTGGFSPLFEMFAASVVFMVLPSKWTAKLRLPVRNEAVLDTGNVKNLVLMRLAFVSNALKGIADTTRQVADKLSDINSQNIGDVYQRTTNVCCKQCGLRSYCWDKAHTSMETAFDDITRILRRNGRVDRENVPGFFSERCCKINELLELLNRNYTDFLSSETARHRVSQIRSVITDQFEGMGVMLSQLAGQFYEIKKFDQKTGLAAADIFQKYGYELSGISCFEDDYGRMTVEAAVLALDENSEDISNITLDLSDISNRIFDYPSIMPADGCCKLTFIEKTTFVMEFGMKQSVHEGYQLCGDAFECFTDSTGKAYCIISDGMGSGGQAAVDGQMTVGLLSNLLKVGFEFDAALKMVNSALLVKSEEESLATIDITEIDLYTGKTQFLKAGAAPTFVRKGGRSKKVQASSLPAGILRGVSFERETMEIGDSDIIVMVSDGVIECGEDWILAELDLDYHCTAQELADKLSEQCKKRRIDGHDDDATVVVIKIERGI